jgi:hypothetical protein
MYYIVQVPLELEHRRCKIKRAYRRIQALLIKEQLIKSSVLSFHAMVVAVGTLISKSNCRVDPIDCHILEIMNPKLAVALGGTGVDVRTFVDYVESIVTFVT